MRTAEQPAKVTSETPGQSEKQSSSQRTGCRVCKSATQLYLCDNHTIQLGNMLDQIPWLLEELDSRIQKLDRVQLGTIGRNRRPEELNAIDFDAAKISRDVRTLILQWVKHVADRHTGRVPPALDTVDTRALARWLYVNVRAIATLDTAGQLYSDIRKLVGSDTKRSGVLVSAINPTSERHFAGPCPTSRGYDEHGQPVECGEILYADVDEATVTCPECKQEIGVEENQFRAARERDLRTVEQLLEVLDNIGEPVEEKTLRQWIRVERLRKAGFLHDGALVATKVHPDDPVVYSLKRVRKLRRRDQQLVGR
jgi:hypothetical protein